MIFLQQQNNKKVSVFLNILFNTIFLNLNIFISDMRRLKIKIIDFK